MLKWNVVIFATMHYVQVISAVVRVCDIHNICQ